MPRWGTKPNTRSEPGNLGAGRKWLAPFMAFDDFETPHDTLSQQSKTDCAHLAPGGELVFHHEVPYVD